METNIVYNKDCMEVIKELPDMSVDCIITDPPYGINYHSGHYKSENPFKPIVNDDTLFIPIDDLWRVLKPTGVMFVFYSHKNPLVDKRVKNILIWLKNNWTAGDLYADFGNQYECIAFMPKQEFKLKSKRYPNVWKFDRIPADKLKHPTQKPTSIIRRLIEVATKENDIVLDPFAGSGTTLVASKQLDRRYIGCEIEKEYYDVIMERLSQKTVGAFKTQLSLAPLTEG